MKRFKFIANPYLFISLYLLLVIEGEHFGGFYLLYILMALPHGGTFALISVAGILSLIGGVQIRAVIFRRILVPVGLLLMVTGLTLFFYPGGAAETFQLTIPLIMFFLFGTSGLCLLINYFYGYT